MSLWLSIGTLWVLKKIRIVHPFPGNYLRGRQIVVRLLCSNKFWLTQSPSSYPTPWKTSADFSKFLLILHDQKKLLFTNNMLTLFMRLKASPEKSLSCDIYQKMINIAIRATYYIFCCRNRNWDSPDLMQFWFDLIISFLLLLFILFYFFE